MKLKSNLLFFVLLVVMLLTVSIPSYATGATTAASTRAAMNMAPQAVTNLWTSDSRTYLLPDGTYEKDVYGQTVNYQNNGKWESIDNSLSLDSSGHYTNKANPYLFQRHKSNERKRRIICSRNGIQGTG